MTLKCRCFSRGKMLNLAWKGEEAYQIELVVTLQDGEGLIVWSVQLTRQGYPFQVAERVERRSAHRPPELLLEADSGVGWWWSDNNKRRVTMKQSSTSCALAAAAADASFPGRDIADYVRRWGFFDPNPFLLRRDWAGLESGRFDHYGRNLGETLHALYKSSPEVMERIRVATRTSSASPRASSRANRKTVSTSCSSRKASSIPYIRWVYRAGHCATWR